jgi:hypothetical protein
VSGLEGRRRSWRGKKKDKEEKIGEREVKGRKGSFQFVSLRDGERRRGGVTAGKCGI